MVETLPSLLTRAGCQELKRLGEILGGRPDSADLPLGVLSAIL